MTPAPGRAPLIRRLAYRVLVRAVRGRAGGEPGDRGVPGAGGVPGDRGTDWGEALIGEFAETTGTWEAVRWTVSGLRVVLRERRAGLLRPPWHRRHRILVAAAVAGMVALLGNWLVAGVVYVPSQSMAPTLRVADRALVDKLGFRLVGIHYGDIVLVEFSLPDPAAPSVLTKRVIGLPGDTIACPDNEVYRNGTRVEESYLGAGVQTRCAEVVVPADSVYLLGDDREVSLDSRQFGPVAQSSVVGRLITRVWPLNRLGLGS